jgi:hypothetical protein
MQRWKWKALSLQLRQHVISRNKRLLVGNHAERLLVAARVYREHVLSGAIDVTKEPESKEEAERIFNFKRQMVEVFVSRVDVLPDKTTRVTRNQCHPL